MITCIRTLALFLALPTLIFFCLGTFSHALSIPPEGQAVVADDDAGTNDSGAVFIVNLSNGLRTLVSDFGDPSQGPTGEDPAGIALQDLNSVIVIDEDAGTNGDGILFRVNLITGKRTVISDFGDPAQGPVGAAPFDVALDGLGNALVIDENANTEGALFSVDLSNGQRTIISDFSDPAQGPLGNCPISLVLDGAGNAIVMDEDAGMNFDGALFRVDLITGDRTLISDFGDPLQGPIGSDPTGITLDTEGNALVVDEGAGTNSDGLLSSVDLTSGQRTIISDFGDPIQGPLGASPRGVTLDGSGTPLVVDPNGGTDDRGLLFRVDLISGQRTIISNFGNPTLGPLGDRPTGVAFRPQEEFVRPIPTLSEWGLIATAGILGLAGLYAARRKKLTA